MKKFSKFIVSAFCMVAASLSYSSLIEAQCGPGGPTISTPNLDFSCTPAPLSALPTTSKCPVALTFDDGPDGAQNGASDSIVNWLHTNRINATFFFNTNNYCDVDTDTVGQNTLKNIVQYGFDIGTHTISHPDLATIASATQITEINGPQKTLNTILGSSAPHLSLFRAPYGSPYQAGTQAQVDSVSAMAAKQGYFHVGWTIDPQDYNCKTVDCVTTGIFNAIDKGQWGVILMHFVYQNTFNALPLVISGLQSRGCEILMVEDFVKAKYGAYSAPVMAKYNGLSTPTTTAATSSSKIASTSTSIPATTKTAAATATTTAAPPATTATTPAAATTTPKTTTSARTTSTSSSTHTASASTTTKPATPSSTTAKPTTTTKSTTAAAKVYYTVVSGDTLSNIASKYGTTYQNLAKWDNIPDPNVIDVGQVLCVQNCV